MLGRPVGHSLSPVLHNAGYAALGLSDWSYAAIDVGEDELESFVAGLGPEWAGLSLTMPLKEVALSVATEVTPLTRVLGAGNTLVLRGGGLFLDNTDAPGAVAALADAGCTSAAEIAIVGAGGTARAALAAASSLGARATVYARRPAAVVDLLPVAAQLDVPIVAAHWEDLADAARADVIVSTVPKSAAGSLADLKPHPDTVVFDVLYDPWPTPLAAAALAAGCRVVSGLDLLAAQAYLQFALFTGLAAPKAAMRAALDAAVAAR
ncbi:shikimate 5-dehydrogenase [Longispora fulva]|uniref:Shikimate dehydrogenase n=1 Tax=Longispora fulva TaxID=619741 RepID=A0A8J7GNL3_9ACTN|nr:shikimate dehydrogenase [Longispora fulva]GIG59039.1 shikimate 5-dehydrogenase [Longispora fulva]